MKILYLCVIVGFAFIAISCNETLPLREDLSNLVTVNVRSKYNTIAHSNNTGTIRIFVSVTNNTDETLDDIAAFTGMIEIVWSPPKEEERLFNRTRTFTLGLNNIFYVKNFNRQTKRLTLIPGDSVVIFVDWNLKTNDSTYILNYFSRVRENQCFVDYPFTVPRRISVRQYFFVKSDIKLFDRLAIFHSEQISISHCFMFPHSGEANKILGLPDCIDFSKFDPCSAIGQ